MVGDGDERCAHSRQALEPDRAGLGQRRDAADRQQHAGHEARAVGRHVAQRERLGDVAEDDLLVGDEAGQAHRVDRHVARPSAPRCASAVPDGASSLAGWWYSMISARCHVRDASAAKRIISTAPIAKFGRDERVRATPPRPPRAAPRRRSRWCRSTTCTPAAERRARVVERRVGPREVDEHVGAAEHVGDRRCRAPGRRGPVSSRSSARLDRRAHRLAHAARGARDGDPDHAAATAAAPGQTGVDGGAEGVLVGADAGRRQALGRPQLVGQLAQVVERRRRRSAGHELVELEQRQAVQQRARRAGSCARRRTPAPARRAP